MQIEKSQNKSSPSPLKVRVGKGYALKFIILHGQRNAEFRRQPPIDRDAYHYAFFHEIMPPLF